MNRYAAYLSLDHFKNDSFVVIQKVLMDDENALFMHCINNLEEYYQKYGEKTVNDAIENIVMFSLYSSRAQNYNLSKLEFMKSVLKKIGVDERSINASFLLSETNLLLKMGQRGQVIQKFQNYINSNQKISKEEIEFIKKYLTNNKISAEWLTEKK